jgi:hypothetical protein
MKNLYINEWAGRVSMARLHRKHFPEIKSAFQHDPAPPTNYTPEDIEWALKIVAYWEGGPEPESPTAVPVELRLEKEEES